MIVKVCQFSSSYGCCMLLREVCVSWRAELRVDVADSLRLPKWLLDPKALEKLGINRLF